MLVDPRVNITHEIQIGQTYRDDRNGAEFVLAYADKNVTLLRDREGYHRLNTRTAFDKEVGAGRYKLDPTIEPFGNTGMMERVLALLEDYRAEDGYTAAHKVEAIEEVLDILTAQGSPDDYEQIPFESLAGIGDKGAANLRRAGFTTMADVRGASDDELLAIDWIGAKGVASLREYTQ